MKKLYTITLLLYSIISAYSQTAPYIINQNHNSCCGGGTTTGSSFKVFGVGQIDSIRIYPRHNTDYTSTIQFFKGNGPNPDSLIHTETFTVVGTYNQMPEKLIILTTPVVVKKDSVYTFYIDGTPIRYNGSNVYNDGTYWDSYGENTSKDVDFIIYIGAKTTTSTSSANLGNDILIQTNSNSLNIINSNKSYQLKLYNTYGLLISEGSNNLMNLPALSEAVYILQLSTDKEIFTRKIYIKQ